MSKRNPKGRQSSSRTAADSSKRRTRKTKQAILSIEASGTLLRRPELIRLLDGELSRICRERDGYRCFISGKRVEPGIGQGTGQAAHLIPRQDVPFWLRYDPRIVVWLEGEIHAAFDGHLGRGFKAANQALVWGKLAKTKPDVFELLTGTDWKHQARETVRIGTMREKLEELRRM